jgi:AcrR family transcriptional regulator
MTRKPKPQLTPQDWIKAAFRTLATHGVGAIKAEVLAKQLNATKGSFYWHFRDVPSFRLEMLALWEADATADIIQHVYARAAPGPERLTLLSQIVSTMNTDNQYGGLKAEPAIRDWARNDAVVSHALARVDQRRLAFVTQLFCESGFDTDQAKLKADLFYSGFVGFQTIAANTPAPFEHKMLELLRVILQR